MHEVDHDKLGVRHVLHEEDTAGQEELSVRLRASECAIAGVPGRGGDLGGRSGGAF